jgi:putative DNA primase/helicase
MSQKIKPRWNLPAVMLIAFASVTMLEPGTSGPDQWLQNRTGLAFQFARELSRDLAIREPDRVRYVASKTSFAGGVERFARSDPAFAVTSQYWDKDPMLLGTPAGTVDLTNGRLSPGNPVNGITKSTAVAPAETAECPLWRRFLHEATNGDEEAVRFHQQWFGYSLTGDVSEQSLLFVFGPGGTENPFISTS